MTTVPFQRVLRGGERRPDSVDVDGDFDAVIREIHEAGCVLTAEVLSNGNVSLCIEEPELGDFECQIATNGPGERSPVAMTIKLLDSWNLKAFAEWKELMS